MNEARQVGLAGFCAVAVAFGPARNGFGLFLPYFRREFGLSVELAGLVASCLQVGYLIAVLVVGLLVTSMGSRLLVMMGGLSAAAGMALVALAPNAAVLATGVILAGTSAGWSWAPYNDAVDRMVSRPIRGRVLSIISTGTTFGIMVAGMVALAAGTLWRAGWVAFSLAALVTTALNAWVLPGRSRHQDEDRITDAKRHPGFAWFLRAEAAPLFAVAFSSGMVSAFYWSFAVDHIAQSSTFSSTAGPLFYVVLGVVGFVGLSTGDAVARFGLRLVLAAALISLAAAAFLLGAVPAWWPAVGVSAILYGAAVMLMSALLSVWSSGVFAKQPSTGFSATLLFFGIGSIVGPAALGAFAGAFGLGRAFWISGALTLLTMFARPIGETCSAGKVPSE